MGLAIRPARESDHADLLRIYNHWGTESHVSFETRALEPEERRAWFAGFADSGSARLLVACDGDATLGYASSTPLRPKPAYATSVETTVYVAPEALGRGVGRALYEALLTELRALGTLHRAFAAIALPNDASIRLHEALGFRHAGTFHEVGYKLGRFWDVAWFELELAPTTEG